MVQRISLRRWEATRTALQRTGHRFAELVRDTAAPERKATRHWTVAETAAHVTSIAAVYAAMAHPVGAPLPFPAVEDALWETNLDRVAGLNELLLQHFPERDPEELGRRLTTEIDRILRQTDVADPGRPVRWLGDSRIPLAGLLAHLLNELQIHGYDIARATGRDWPVAAGDAALFLDLFLVGLLRYDPGRLAETMDRAPARPITVELRSAHTTPVTLVLEKGRLSVREADGRADVRLSFDPAVLTLMLFRRTSRARALLTRKVTVSGPRPWLLPVFLRVVRLP